MRTLILPALCGAAIALMACGCGSASRSSRSSERRADAPVRLWEVVAGEEPGAFELEGDAPSGLEVDLVDGDGWAARARITEEAPRACDDCGPRVVARASAMARPLDTDHALAISPPSPRAAEVTWHPYALTLVAAEDAVVWASVDREGDGRPDVELVVWCGERVASGCDGHVCGEACSGTRVLGATHPSDATCHRFVPDVDDCPPGR